MAKNNVACTSRMLVPCGRLVASVGASHTENNVGGCLVIVIRIVDRRMGRTISEPYEVLGDKEADMMSVDNSLKASSTTAARSIKKIDILETSSSTVDNTDTESEISGGKVTSKI